MIKRQEQDNGRRPVNQGVRDVIREPNKINASTPYDFNGRNLTPYGGLLPVVTMLERLDFQSLVEQTLTSKRIPRAMDLYRFVLGIVLGLYIGFPRLNQLRFIARDPILTGILKVSKLPVQSTFWRFINALHRNVARQILTVTRTMRERVWEAANVKLEVVTIDTDTTVHTLYGQQMGGRKGYNPKNKGKKSYQPMLTFLAETREYVWGELRNGDRPSGKQIYDHLRNVQQALPPGVKQIYGRADSGFYCREAVEAYEEFDAQFVICARKTSRLVEELRMLTFIAETREYVWGELRNGDRPSGKQIYDHLRNVQQALPPGVKQIYGRADSGFYCREAVEAYEEFDAQFVICARKTSRLVEELRQARWKSSPKTDADAESEFRYQPDGWSKPYRFVALRYEETREQLEAEETAQSQLFATSQYTYRVFVTDMSDPIYFVAWFYRQRGGAENLIKEANNDAGLAAHPSGRFDVNGNHFQLAMLAYNLNCWLMLFNREPQADVTELRHTTLAISRLRFLFVAAKIWRHAGRTGVSYSDHYAEKGMFGRLMDRLRGIMPRGGSFAPVLAGVLT